MRRVASAVVVLLLSVATRAGADASLFVGEPYGRFGSLNPTGHAAIYLTRVCATSSTVLRRCAAGETGVVISRYQRIAGLDWIAIPLVAYLYAVDRSDHAPAFAGAKTVAGLRDQYRHAHLRDLIPDGPGGAPPDGQWIQLVGAAYDRQIVAFTIDTTEEQDNTLIRELNSRTNKSQFNLIIRNCADLARDILNLYYPKALHRSFIADLGVTTPKQLAKSLVRYSSQQTDVQVSTFVIPQIPGSRPASKDAHGVLESLVRSKKYVVPLIVVQPWLPTGLAAGYLVSGRFNLSHYATPAYAPSELERLALVAAEPLARDGWAHVESHPFGVRHDAPARD